ncbi:unnamed protein product [Arabis nemorensis]|uniref:Phorbol-ester/DAG-type domain-containing protein n=1 Tax=Arabis nemorensis TaxID=586526 RepID=A0A565CTC8_9BRAS|nr:unnamed protein product [Arabis nemorensis]
MDTRAGKLLLPIHEHPIFPSARIVLGTCKGCGVEGFLYGGYTCNDSDCKVWFHKECAEAPSEINHPYHQQHPLLLTSDMGGRPCDLCGQKPLETAGYSCSTCDFNVDLTCGIKPAPPVIEHPLCHDHPLVFLKKREKEALCEVCKEDTIGRPSYSCLGCDLYFHVDCVQLSKEVNHPCHSNHLLKLLPSESLTVEAEKTCLLCERQQENMLYHCSICNFTACLGCTKNPPPLSIDHTKTHKHELTLFPNAMSYYCQLSGTVRDSRAYMCLPCGFFVNGYFISLPRVININRHDHRISFTHELGPGYLNCGVCRKSVRKDAGAYACVVCCNYAVHSQCAVEQDVWDGVELEGTPEIIEDVSPFRVMGDNLIRHFSHEKHNLRLHKECSIIHDEYTRCEACTYPIGFDPIYSCEGCPFILHEKCANLPTKRRLVFDTTPFTLVGASSLVRDLLDCSLCGECSTGFKYVSRRNGNIDVHCGSLSEPFIHDGHLHPLYFDGKENSYCNACHKVLYYMLCCIAGDRFDLCFSCASLPTKIRHRNDEHPLTLCCGEKANGNYWCDICETKLDPRKWFYTCFDCGVTLHVECVLGDFSRLMPGRIIDSGWEKNFDVVVNNHNTRPLCIMCRSRCKVSVILKVCDEDDGYICSRSCLSDMFLARSWCLSVFF